MASKFCMMCTEKKRASEFVIDKKFRLLKHHEHCCAECIFGHFVAKAMDLKERGERNQETSIIRARRLGLPYKRIPNLELILWDVQDNKCLYCQRTLCANMAGYDHIIPLKPKIQVENHPGHSLQNIALVCAGCNSSKKNDSVEDWASRKFPNRVDEILLRVERHIEIMKRESGE